VLETVPTAGFTDQVNPVFDDPLTVAENCWVWDALREAVNGVRETVAGGARAMLALADLVVSAALVALTVTVCGLEIDAGVVYKPLLEIVPTAGLKDQVTPVLVVPLTAAVNCCA
jgi:hypothetical protein